MPLAIKDGNGSAVDYPAPIDPVFHCAVYNQTAVASSTDVVQLKGSATKTVRVLKVRVTFVPGIATAAAQEVRICKRTTAATVATTTNLVVNTNFAKHDSNDAAATAVLSQLDTTAATVGTIAGIIKAESLMATAAIVAPHAIEFNALTGGDKPIVLRGILEFLTIGFNGVTPGANFSWEIIWSEAAT